MGSDRAASAHGMKRVDDRRVLSGIVHALRSGGRWADCADVYGPKKTLYNRFVRWSERGIWEGIFSALAGSEEQCASAGDMPAAENLIAVSHGPLLRSCACLNLSYEFTTALWSDWMESKTRCGIASIGILGKPGRCR